MENRSRPPPSQSIDDKPWQSEDDFVISASTEWLPSSRHRRFSGHASPAQCSPRVEVETSLDYLATGIPKADDLFMDGSRFLDDASHWSFPSVFVIPVAPF
jgi:hypothetical protein